MSHKMDYAMRWFGEPDKISLSEIKQAGAASVVTALHHIPVGAVWTVADIAERKKIIEDAGLKWTVVESLPVHEDIKKRKGDYKTFIGNYISSMQNLAGQGIRVITYNFMPALDWVRTDLSFTTQSGAVALRFEWNAYVSFDLFILQRPGAEKDYSETDIWNAREYFAGLNEEQVTKLAGSCLLGLPGSTGSFTREEVLGLLAEYDHISEQQLQQHLFDFLNEILPVAESLNLQLAIHPDDPPFPVFGLPRIMSTGRHMEDLVKNVHSPHSGFCFCTGSLGAREDNDLRSLLQQYSERVFFLHLRSVEREGNKNFHEANHLEGHADLIPLIAEINQIQAKQDRSIPMRPDHGHMISSGDKAMYPGYSYIGRLKALAEIKAVEETVLRLNPNVM